MSVNSVYKFSEIYPFYSLNFCTNKQEYFSKLALGFHYEPESLDVNEICFDQEQVIPNTRQKSRISRSVTIWFRRAKCGAMDTNIERLSCGEVQDFDTFNIRI